MVNILFARKSKHNYSCKTGFSPRMYYATMKKKRFGATIKARITSNISSQIVLKGKMLKIYLKKISQERNTPSQSLLAQ